MGLCLISVVIHVIVKQSLKLIINLIYLPLTTTIAYTTPKTISYYQKKGANVRH